jgi:NADH-quinone oxidoreductase subunit C
MDGQAILSRLTTTFSGRILETHAHRGDATAVVERTAILDVLRCCRDDADLRCDVLMDLTGVDYLKYPGRELGPRFEVVYHLYSLPHNHRLRIKVSVEEDGSVPSAVPLWPIADWFEREVWDMFGIRFDGHPGLRRLLMYEEFQGHPLRKDYPVNKRQPLIGPRN